MWGWTEHKVHWGKWEKREFIITTNTGNGAWGLSGQNYDVWDN